MTWPEGKQKFTSDGAGGFSSMGHWAWMRGLVDWETFRRLEREPNPLERDYQLKRAMGFPMETFTRIWQLLRQPANRLLEP